MRIGILGPSDIAFRRFLPAIKTSKFFEFVGIAIANINERNYVVSEEPLKRIEKSKEKAVSFMKKY